MTGQGRAVEESEQGTVLVEVRTVNNRGFKCALRLSDSLFSFESRIEALARSLIHRGTVHLSVSWRSAAGEDAPRLDADVLRGYYRQLKEIQAAVGDSQTAIDLATLTTLPGVLLSPRDRRGDDEGIWNLVVTVIRRAIANLNEMRAGEGAHMADTLRGDCDQIRRSLDKISRLAPRAAEAYRVRLETKVRRLLAEHELEVPAVDLLREVQIFADRADISEEITRLESHLKMFLAALEGNGDGRDPTGRKLDFVIQEMFRETNTIGSKAADSEVSAEVVEIKCAIERMRELVQNLE